MTPAKHHRFHKRSGTTFTYMFVLFVLFEILTKQSDYLNNVVVLPGIRECFIFFLAVSGLFFVVSFIYKAECESCGSLMTRHFHKTITYECVKCGRVFDTGEEPPNGVG